MYKRLFSFWPAALSMALTALALAAPQTVWACGGTVICVDGDAPGPSHNGLTWTTAYTNVQDALAAATTGNEIWVAEGVYYPDEGAGQTAGNQAASFFLESGVAIYGGFDATETERAQRDWDTHITVLSGDLAGNDTADAHGVVLDWENVVGTDNTYQIVTGGYYSGGDVTVNDTAVLDGFTITAGRDLRNDGSILHGIGAGLITYKSNPTLRHLIFSGNQAKVGGGIYLWEGPAITMTDLTFTGNVATQGGGLYCRSIPLTLDQFLFQNNETRNLTAAVQSGGGMAGTGSVTLTNGQFIDNTSGSAGGLSTSGGPVNLSHVVFDSNQATEGNSGAGGMVSEAGNPVLTDVTFVRNSSNGWGGGYYHQNSALSLSRVSFIDNVTTWSYGGGLAAIYAPTVITDALFAGNTAAGDWGSGMLIQGESLTMTNAVFQGNGSDALTLYSGATGALRNVTVAGNGDEGINLVSSSNLQVSNSIVYGNGGEEISGGSGVTVTYSIVDGGCPGGGTTCDQASSDDPLFVLPVVQSAVPTSTGDLRLRATSPAIDAGDNSAVPAGLTTDPDGNPRFIDTPAVTDTGSGTPPIVDRGAYEYPGKPDLEVSKTNNVAGVVAPGGSFNWILTVSNTGGYTATFSSGASILQDNLPTTGATYGSPTVQNITGLSGTVNCTLASNTLACTANGTVTLTGPGQFNVVVPVTSTELTTLTNPRAAGVCQVDPSDDISELVEDNNTCNSDSVVIGQATLTTVIHDAAHNIITTAPLSETIYSQATVVSSSGGITPTGMVTLTLHDNAACAAPALVTDVQPLVNGVAESSHMEARSFYYQVTYSGDSSYQPLTSTCTLFTAYQPGPAFTVNTSADDDNTVDNFVCSDIHCTLREAILAANGAVGANTILFDIGSGQTLTLASALPAINDVGGVTIDGQSYDVTISGADLYRVFKVSSNAQATLDHLTIVYGRDTGTECSGDSCGGGLKIESGATVTMTHSAILSSTANIGGGITNEGGLLRLTGSTLAGNTAAKYGGGIVNKNGTLSVENSTLSGNTANGTGSNEGGGALDQWGSSAAATFTNSTVVSNTAVSPNQATSGLWLENGTLSLHNSIVANNNGTNNFQQSGGTFTSQGYNLSNAWNGLSSQSTDLTGNPLLAALGAYGSSTRTFALLPGSPAIDAGNACLSTDQRGITRPQLGGCDIGAFESQGFTLTYAGGSNQNAAVQTAFSTPLAVTVSSSAGEPVDGGQVVFTGPASGAALSSSPLTVTISSGEANWAVTANGIGGNYIVTAAARGGLNTISYSLTNAAPAPEIAMIGNAQVIDDGDTSPSTADHTDFGSVALGQTLTRTLTLSNSGEADLSLTGSPKVNLTGANASDFSVVVQPATTIGPKATTTFQIRFTPSVTTTRVATVTIANNDGDEALYDFAIQGTGTNQAPVADAGSDQSANVGTVVTLNGSASADPDGHTLSYGWTQTGGPAVTLSSATAVSPTFTAPGTSTILTFTLRVTDAYGLAASAADEVVITVKDVSAIVYLPLVQHAHTTASGLGVAQLSTTAPAGKGRDRSR